MISEYADFESVFYMARMRAMKALDLIGLPQKLDGLLISVFLNAFSAGVEYERKYGTPD